MAKKGFLDGYKTYDPEEEGYGNPEQWRGEFRVTMGLGEAKEIIGSTPPREILGVAESAPWAEVRRAYKRRVLEVHPDRGGSETKMKKVNAAWAVLARFRALDFEEA